MKKTILVVLMALVFATPCLAQEIEPDISLGLDGTEWWGYVRLYNSYEHYGFYQGKVYRSFSTTGNEHTGWREIGEYTDFPLFSFFAGTYYIDIDVAVRAVLLPEMGIGFGYETWSFGMLSSFHYRCIFNKESDAWQPPE